MRRGGNRKGVMFRILRDIAPFLSLKRLVAGIGRMSIFEERQEERGRRCCWEMGVGCTEGVWEGCLGERGLYYPVVLEWERGPDERRGAPFAKVRIGSG